MADLGADVVHVESPRGGDAARKMGPQRDGTYLWWKVIGRNKRSVTLDLNTDAGKAVARRLAEWADVVITNLRASTLERWGIDWSTLHEVNRRIIMLQVSGYGASGPMRDAPGFGKMGEARSGVVHLTGFPEGPPVHTGFSHADSVTGLMGAFAVTAALYRRNTDPEFAGEWIDLALFEPLFRLIEWQIIVYDQLGVVPNRSGNRLAVAPAAVVNTFLSKDNEWITVTSATNRSVLNVVRLLGLNEAEYVTTEQQVAAADEINSALQAWVGDRTADEALALLEEAGVVASRVFTAADIVADPVYAERMDIISLEDPDLGEVRMQAVVPKMANYPGVVWRTGPELGSDNDLVLGEWLGLSVEERSALRQQGVE
jgi:formyl-CoA transferase